MKLGELLIVGIVWGLPLWLVSRAWRRYFVLGGATSTNVFSARAALALLSVSSGIWLLFYPLVLIAEYSKVAKSILNLVPTPPTLGVLNLLVCLGSFVLSLFMPKTVQGTVPVRSAFIVASGYMVLIWTFALISH